MKDCCLQYSHEILIHEFTPTICKTFGIAKCFKCGSMHYYYSYNLIYKKDALYVWEKESFRLSNDTFPNMYSSFDHLRETFSWR